jgi:hypothetical protein
VFVISVVAPELCPDRVVKVPPLGDFKFRDDYCWGYVSGCIAAVIGFLVGFGGVCFVLFLLLRAFERECCLLVLNLVSSSMYSPAEAATLPCIRQPRPRLMCYIGK